MFTPSSWTGSRPQNENPKLNLKGNAPYFLMHHPYGWELVFFQDQWTWLPTFSKLRELPGVNGVEDTPQGADSTVSRIKFSDNGYQIIDREFGYVARYETTRGTYYYCNKWNIPKIIGREVFWKMDSDGWNEWRLSLVEGGIINHPEPEIIESKRMSIDRKIDRRIKFQHIPEIKKEIDGLYEIKKLMLTAFKELTEPKKKRKKNA